MSLRSELANNGTLGRGGKFLNETRKVGEMAGSAGERNG